MKIMIIHTGNPCECFIASCILRGIKNKNKKYPEVFIITADKECSSIFEHNSHVKKVYQLNKIPIEIFKYKCVSF